MDDQPLTHSPALPVAVDAMGGDRAPSEPVEGAVRAVRELGIPVTLVGRTSEIDALVRGLGGPFDQLSIIDAPDVITMEEHAVAAARKKTRASVTVALEQITEKRAGAVVSAGHSGAVVAAALFSLGRVEGIERPAIGVPFPSVTGHPVLLIDAGAFTDPRPVHLLQFAYLASSYLTHVENHPSPKVALLSNGEESGKGNNLIREAHQLLARAQGINFIGNVEGNRIPSGTVDVVVSDGFTANVALKTAEGVAYLVQAALREELTSRWYLKLLAAGLRPALTRVAKRLDYREYGGAPLLGVRGVVIIAHGRSDSTAIRNAIRVAQKAAGTDLSRRLARDITPAAKEVPEL